MLTIRLGHSVVPSNLQMEAATLLLRLGRLHLLYLALHWFWLLESS